MANKDAAFGLRPVSKLDGSDFNGAIRHCYFAGDTSTTIYPGDPVKLTGTGDANGVPAVTLADAGDAIWGVMVGVAGDADEDLVRDTPRYLSTAAGYLQAVKADNVIFEIQEDSVGGDLAATNIGNKLDLIAGTPSTSHPIRSAYELDSSTATTATAQVQIIGFPRRADNEIGTNANWLVTVAEIQTAGV
jgi:hypothetical protein